MLIKYLMPYLQMHPVDWFAVTSLCWLPLLIGLAGSWGLAKALAALGVLEEEDEDD